MGYLHIGPSGTVFCFRCGSKDSEGERERRRQRRQERERFENGEVLRGDDTELDKESTIENKVCDSGQHTQAWGWSQESLVHCLSVVSFHLYRDKLMWFELVLLGASVQAHVLLVCCSVNHDSNKPMLWSLHQSCHCNAGMHQELETQATSVPLRFFVWKWCCQTKTTSVHRSLLAPYQFCSP